MSVFRVPIEISRRSIGYKTGATVVDIGQRRIVSMPSMLGCPVGCTFCISSVQPYIDRIPSSVLVNLFRGAVGAWEGDVEMSWTGEGEPILNEQAILDTVACIAEKAQVPIHVRVAFSGIHSKRMFSFVSSLASMSKVRVLCSLHTMDPRERSRLIPRSASLGDLNVVLQGIATVAEVECNMVHGLSSTPIQWHVEQFACWMPNREVGLVFQPRLSMDSAMDIQHADFDARSETFISTCTAMGIKHRVLRHTARDIQPWYHELTYQAL